MNSELTPKEESQATFPLFIPSDSIPFTYQHAVYGWILLSIFFYLLNDTFWLNDTLNSYALVFLWIGFLGFNVAQVMSYRIKEPLQGRFSNSIEFYRDRIIVAGNMVLLADIRRIRFFLGHFNNEKDNSLYGTITPRIYNGNDNRLELEGFDKEIKSVYFHIAHETDFDDKMTEHLKHYKQEGKFLFLS